MFVNIVSRNWIWSFVFAFVVVFVEGGIIDDVAVAVVEPSVAAVVVVLWMVFSLVSAAAAVAVPYYYGAWEEVYAWVNVPAG